MSYVYLSYKEQLISVCERRKDRYIPHFLYFDPISRIRAMLYGYLWYLSYNKQLIRVRERRRDSVGRLCGTIQDPNLNVRAQYVSCMPEEQAPVRCARRMGRKKSPLTSPITGRQNSTTTEFTIV